MLEKIYIDDVVKIARQAGSAIMDVYEGDVVVEYKSDDSPLTIADKRANIIICEGLDKLPVPLPILSEENKEVEYEERKGWEYYWCVDPLDGTKEFIKKSSEFTVNIALIHKSTPVLGVVYAPAIGELYYAKKGEGAFKVLFDEQSSVISKERLPIPHKRDELVVVASKSHLTAETEQFINQLATNNQRLTTISKGSSLKICMVAEGSADIYPRLGPTMEWDTAAADAVVRESGKMVYNYATKKEIAYNKKELINPWLIVK